MFYLIYFFMATWAWARRPWAVGGEGGKRGRVWRWCGLVVIGVDMRVWTPVRSSFPNIAWWVVHPDVIPSLLCRVPFPGLFLLIPLSIFTWVPAWLFPFKVLFPPVSFGTDPYVGNERGCFSTDEENYFKCFSSNRLGSVEIDVMK